jgi:transposase InsO family protein
MGLRVSRRWGPARIGYRLRLHPSTVHKVLARYEAPRLAWTDPATGCRLRAKPKPVRYEHPAPGDLVHVDVKKLGRIPDGGGHRVHGRAKGNRVKKNAKPGTAYIHHAMDDHSRLVYSEILTDERKETASEFWTRANAYFASCGITVLRVLTDNGSAYRSHLFAETLGTIKHKRTRPYRPQTNGKVERFNRTMAQEWAYATAYTSESERVAAYADFIHTYNHHRGHTALGGKSPADRVPNLCGAEHLGQVTQREAAVRRRVGRGRRGCRWSSMPRSRAPSLGRGSGRRVGVEHHAPALDGRSRRPMRSSVESCRQSS